MSGTNRLGRYVVGERVGTGGLAEVYTAHAEGAKGFRKRLVIKRLRRELLASDAAAASLLAEAQLVQRLSHGNIVQVFDFGVEDGAPYVVMEHVDGVALAELVDDARTRGEPLGAAAVRTIAASVCAALEYAHAAVDDDDRPLALVHRDVTPANVLVSREGLVKLTDFGIARVGAAGPDAARGTPGYVAPEQAAGLAVDARADLYGLGVVLAELAAPLPDGPREVLQTIADKAAAPAPARRFASAQEFARALETSQVSTLGGREELAARVRRVQATRKQTAQRLGAALDDRGPRTVALAREARPPRRGATPIGLVLVSVAALAGLGVQAWQAPDADLPELDEDPSPPSPAAASPGSPSLASARSPSTTAASQSLPPPTVAPPDSPSLPSPTAAPPDSPSRPEPSPGTVATAPRSPDEGAVAPRPRAPRQDPPREPGRLRINVIPWAEVRLDGRGVGRTPLDLSVEAGRHAIELTNPASGQRRERTIVVEAGGEALVSSW